MPHYEQLDEQDFGAFLTQLRFASSHRIKQRDVVKRLAGWTTSSYSRLENGEIAPRFDHLCSLYEALQQAGVQFTSQMRQRFVDLARQRIARQRTHKDIHSDEEWIGLQFELARLDTRIKSDAEMLVPLLSMEQGISPLQELGLENISLLQMPSVTSVPLTRINSVEGAIEQQLGLWLLVAVRNLTPFFDEGWSLETLLESLRVVLKGVQAMPTTFTRRQLLQLGATAATLNTSTPTGKHVTEEERIQLCNTLSDTIGTSWKLFSTVGNAQVLTVGYAQLALVQQMSSHLPAKFRPLVYSGVYRLIGAALHFQGHYEKAFSTHEIAYLAAFEAMDVWNMAQCRCWQANGLRDQKRYQEALETIDVALQLISQCKDIESIRLRAHLLASAAEIAAFLGKKRLMKSNLETSQRLLEHLMEPHEEFDNVSWYQYSGTCSLILECYDEAIVELKRTVEMLPVQPSIRHATTLMPLAIAYARRKEPSMCLETLKQATESVRVINAPSLNMQFSEYLEQEVLKAFPQNEQIRAFVMDTQQRLLSKEARS